MITRRFSLFRAPAGPPRRGASRAWWPLWVASVGFGLPAVAHARPEAPAVLCAAMPEAAACAGQVAECSMCHTATWPPAWNDYGVELIGALGDGDYIAAFSDALVATAELDADGDGRTNAEELLRGTAPGAPDDARESSHDGPYCVDPGAHVDPTPAAGDAFVPGYDFVRAYRRVHVLYCGRSPSYDELRSFESSAPRAELRHTALHEALSRCLAGDYWRDEGVPRLADDLIRPVSAIGRDSSVGVIVGDYAWDYRLFSYAMTGDRDVRDLLVADYHVQRGPDGALKRVEGVVPPEPGVLNPGGTEITGQPLEPVHRAGMITTQWFLARNTMFADLPRTTAAQAYRAYLGFDIARLQGIRPVPSEPRDIDAKGVAEPECAICHSTLDPLSYAFTYYEGFPRVGTQRVIPGTYSAERPERRVEGWADNQSWLLGEPVGSVVEWADRAAQSDAFRRNLALELFQHAFDRAPTLEEQPAFDRAWRAWPDEGWSANALIHHLVDFSTFGGLR